MKVHLNTGFWMGYPPLTLSLLFV
uniref:Uncharacterized protein n=1 Tax=Rhizophora mucronata TaxID=61149 RepID=A0A2P2PBE3_RHIMU